MLFLAKGARDQRLLHPSQGLGQLLPVSFALILASLFAGQVSEGGLSGGTAS